MSQPVITPADLIDGEIPSGFEVVHLKTSASDQISKVILPRNPQQGHVVIFTATSMQGIAEVTVSGGEGLDAIEYKIAPPAQNSFTFDDGVWVISGANVSVLSPRVVGNRIPDNPQSLTSYHLQNGNFVSKIFLPDQATNGDLIFITSNAGSVATVAPGALLFNSTIKIRKGDLYVFAFLGAFEKWGLWHSPTRTPKLTSELAQPIAPRTRYTVRPANWLSQVKLPQQAGDRDRIIITSTAQRATRILPANIINPAAMTVSSGEEYEFLYVKEKKGWFMERSPDTRYEAKDLLSGNVPALVKPRTIISLSRGKWHGNITLPKSQPKGSRVIVENTALRETQVRFRGLSHPVKEGEIVAFKVNNKGVWVKETITIDLLLLYSDEAAALLGEGAMKQRLLEGLRLTNEALENSGANFRFRSKALRQIPAVRPWNAVQLDKCWKGNNPGEPDLTTVLCLLSGDTMVEDWLDELAADGVYYEGTERTPEYCGFGGYNDDSRMIVAVGSVTEQDCSLNVMAHELGHGMGLNHPGETVIKGKPYGVGYAELNTIMANGYSHMVYSTPHRYHRRYGIPMGIPNQIDAVRAMNEVAAERAAYRSEG